MRINLNSRSAAEDSLKELYADTDQQLQKYRLTDHDELKDVEKRLGKPMAHSDLIRRVTRSNPSVWAEDSINHTNGLNFYTSRNGEKTCLNAAFEKGFLPEYTTIFTDAADLPVKKVVGWRDILIRLMAAKALTWSQVERIFGDAYGLNSTRWQQYARQFKG